MFGGTFTNGGVFVPPLTSAHGVTSFTPSELPNLALWLKADALTLNDGDAVSSWTDSSGVGRNATQAGASTLKPTYKTNILNGLPVVRFDGGDYLSHSLIASNPTALTFFVVAKRTAAAGTMVVWGHRNSSTNLIQMTYEGNTDLVLQMRSSGNSIKQPTITGKDTTAAHIFTARFNKPGNSHQLWFNGGSVATDTTAFGSDDFTATLETVGATNATGYAVFFKGDIAEIVAYSASLSDTDRGSVQTYLATKYGLTLA